MATSKENVVEVTVKLNIKYDNEIKKAGEKLKIRESDLEELKKKGYIEYIPATSPGNAQASQQPPQSPPSK